MATDARNPDQPNARSGASQIEGDGALDLYVAEMTRNIQALNAQLDLLRASYAERKKLLRQLAENGPPENEVIAAETTLNCD